MRAEEAFENLTNVRLLAYVSPFILNKLVKEIIPIYVIMGH